MTKTILQHSRFKQEAVPRDFLQFFFPEPNPFGSLINSLKWFRWKIRFREDIREKRDSTQCDTAPSRTRRSITLRGVNS